MTLIGFTTMEERDFVRLERCEDELLRLRIAVGQLQAMMSEFEKRLEVLEKRAKIEASSSAPPKNLR